MTTADETAALMAAIERAKKRILCHPDAFERIDRVVRDGGYGHAYKVIALPLLIDPDQVIVMWSEAEQEANMQQLAMQSMREMIDEGVRQAVAEANAEMEYRRQAWLWDTSAFRSPVGSWFGGLL